MDQKISALSALSLLAGTNDKIQGERIQQDLRVILSAFHEEILSDDEYNHLLELLGDEKYIVRNSGELKLTLTGVSLVRAVGTELLGTTQSERLSRMLETYRRDQDKYVTTLNKQLKNLQENRDEKVQEVSGELIRVAGFTLDIDHQQSELYVHTFKLDQRLMRNEDFFTIDLNYAVRKHAQENGYPIITRRIDTGLKLIAPVRLSSFSVFATKLEQPIVERIHRQDIPEWDERTAEVFIDNGLWRLGYLSVQGGRTYIKYGEFIKTETSTGVFRESPALHINYSDLKQSCVFVWIESYTSPSTRVLDLLSENIKDLNNKQEILDYLEGLRLRRLPSGSEVEVVDILLQQDINSMVPGSNRTYADYWKQTHKIDLQTQIQPMMIVKGFNEDLHYPTEVIYVDRYSLEKRFRHFGREPKPESPEQRFRTIQDLFFAIKNLPSKQEGIFRIALKRFTPTAKELIDQGIFESVIRIRQPMLEFANGTYSLDPRSVFNHKYLPVCGRKHITITHFVVPDTIDVKNIGIFCQNLAKEFSQFGFGSIVQAKDPTIIRYSSQEDVRELETKLRELVRTQSKNTYLAVAIVPDNDDFYYSLKRLMPMRTRIPLQCVSLSTFNDIYRKTFKGYQNLCVKILIKLLNKGESIWNLSSSAGLSESNSLFLGIGFSRFPREKKVSKCAAVLHNAHGDKVSWQVFSAPQERTISKQWFDNLLRRVKAVIESDRPNRLVIYRKGQLFPEERDAVQESLKAAYWLSSIKVSFVSILDASTHRFYLYDKQSETYDNLPAGYAIVINSKEILLSTSNYDERGIRQGTIIPIRLRLDVGDDYIVDVVKEYHDLTYLSWQAPTTTSKVPLVITIAERFAELTREGISAENTFYLDL